jgi:hypothetical protein
MMLLLALVASATSLAPPRFAAAPGWHAGHNRVHACAGVPRRRCEQVTGWASTVRFRDCGDCVPPHRTLDALPRDGIVVQLMLSRETTRVRERPLAWPSTIRRGDVVGPLEGTGDRIGGVMRFGRLHGFNASLWVFFGRRHPSAEQVARANRELRLARLP